MINLSWGRFPEQCVNKDIINIAIAENRKEIGKSLANYSTPGGDVDLRKIIGETYGVGSESYQCLGLTVSTNLSHYIALKLFCKGRVITPDPTFSCYFSQFSKLDPKRIKLVKYEDLSNPASICSRLKQGDIISMVVPNNPTGELVDLDSITKIFEHTYSIGAKVVVDATWHHTLFDPIDNFLLSDLIKNAIKYESIVLLGVSKTYGLSGLRCSLVFSSPEIVENILSWSDDLIVTIGQFEQHLLRHLIKNNQNPLMVQKLIDIASSNAEMIEAKLSPVGYKCITPKAGIFSYVKLPPGKNSRFLADILKQNGVLVYSSDYFSSKSNGIRLCLSESTDNTRIALEIIGKSLC